MKHSMSRVGKCIDNGPMEGFFGILKTEMFYGKEFNSLEELKYRIVNYIEFYNNDRFQKKIKLHVSVGVQRACSLKICF